MDEKENILRRFGTVVRLRRKALGITQEELAERAEMDRAYLGEVERGQRNASLFNLCKIAEALEVEPAFLLTQMYQLDPKMIGQRKRREERALED